MANHACITKRDPCRLDVIRRTTRHVLSTYQNECLNEQEGWNKHTLHYILCNIFALLRLKKAEEYKYIKSRGACGEKILINKKKLQSLLSPTLVRRNAMGMQTTVLFVDK